MASCFAADVSHELRSPLQALAAAAGVLIRRRDRLDERSAVAGELVADEVNRFQHDLLEMARAGQSAEWSTVDIGGLARQVCQARGVPTQVVLVEDAAPWQADRRRMEQVLSNLVDNA